MAKKPNKPTSGGAPEKPDPDPPDAKQPTGGDENAGAKSAKKAAKGDKAAQGAAGSPPETPEAKKSKPSGKGWWDKYEKIKYRGKAYVLAFADVTPRLKDAQLATFVTLVEGLGRILTSVVVCVIDGVIIVIDGINRLRAAVKLGYEVPLDVRENLTREEMRTLAVALNYHRRHLGQPEKEKQIKVELKNDPERSDKAIAADLGVSHVTVGKYRRKLVASGQIDNSDKRRDRQGHLRPATQPPRNTTTTAKPTAETSNAVPAIDNKSDAKAATDETPGAILAEHSQTSPQAANHPAPGTKNDATEQPNPVPAKPSLKTAVLDAGGVFVAVRSAVTRIVNLLGTESGRKADRESISKFADELDQLAHKLRDALTPPEADKGAPGVGG